MLFTKENTSFRPRKWVNTPAQPMIGLLKALSVAFTVLFAFNCGVGSKGAYLFSIYTPLPPSPLRKVSFKKLIVVSYCGIDCV
jgi:hypothetical protein